MSSKLQCVIVFDFKHSMILVLLSSKVTKVIQSGIIQSFQVT